MDISPSTSSKDAIARRLLAPDVMRKHSEINLPDETPQNSHLLVRRTYEDVHYVKRLIQAHLQLTLANGSSIAKSPPVTENDLDKSDQVGERKLGKTLSSGTKLWLTTTLSDEDKLELIFEKGTAQSATEFAMSFANKELQVGQRYSVSTKEMRQLANSKAHNRRSRIKKPLCSWVATTSGP